MKKYLIVLIVIGAFVIISISSMIGMYNGLVRQQEQVATSWSQVETQYQRRFDLILNLVGATKGVLRQEQAVFGAIAEARTHYAGTQTGTDERVAATNQMETALSRLMVIVENYPQLKSDQTVRGLMDELAGTENRIQISRERYNEQVKIWNVQVKVFPRSVLASMFGFKEKTFFKSEEEANKATKVNLEL
jgi:LemA protein